jgi:hypothetical protein
VAILSSSSEHEKQRGLRSFQCKPRSPAALLLRLAAKANSGVARDAVPAVSFTLLDCNGAARPAAKQRRLPPAGNAQVEKFGPHCGVGLSTCRIGISKRGLPSPFML